MSAASTKTAWAIHVERSVATIATIYSTGDSLPFQSRPIAFFRIAFSDGVIAIIITIMVLEMKVPHGGGLGDLAPLLPVFLSYVLSFVYVGIYWNNHHHMLHACTAVKGSILWANLHLLFWLSLFPGKRLPCLVEADYEVLSHPACGKRTRADPWVR